MLSVPVVHYRTNNQGPKQSFKNRLFLKKIHVYKGKSVSVSGHAESNKLNKKIKRDRKVSEPPSFHRKYFQR